MSRPIHYPDQFRGLSKAQEAQARTLLRLLRADAHTWKREDFSRQYRDFPSVNGIFKEKETMARTNGSFFLCDNIGCSIDLIMYIGNREVRNPEGRLCKCRFIGTICQEGLNGDPLGLGRSPLNNVWVIPPHYFSAEAFDAHNTHITPYGDLLDFQAKTAISGRHIHVAATPHGEQYSIQKPEGTIYWEGLFEGIVVAQSGDKRRVFAHLNEHFFALSLKRLDAATGDSADTAGSGVSAMKQKGGPDA